VHATATDQRTAHRETSEVASHQPWSVLILLGVAQFMVILDITVVNVALPSIGQALGFAAADLQWVVTIYVLFTGGLLLLGGRLADLFDRRLIFLTGLSVFTAASLASALAPSPTALVVARAAQGLGAALLTPAALSIVTTTYTASQRSVALSAWGAIGSAGAAAGVLFGGILTSWLSWEWVFLINVPVGIVAAALTLRLIPAGGPAVAERKLDLTGAVTVVAGLMVFVYALDGTADHGWSSARTLLLLALAAALLASFAMVERASRRPLLPPATWRIRALVSSGAVTLGVTGILVGTFFLNSLYLQHVLDASALETGLAFLPLSVAIGLAAHTASRLLPRVGSRAIVVGGLVLTAAGALVLSGAPDEASYLADLLPGLLVLGIGVGLVFPGVTVTAMDDVQAEQAGLASGFMATSHELGAALGVAVLSAIAAAAGDVATGAGLAAGYQDGFIAAACIAVALAALALATVPSVRPAADARMSPH
jgi:EmrB/QacA subfamily drug resistance transporter